MVTGDVGHSGDTSDLGPANEEAWRQLRRQFELVEGFWLGFVFCRTRNVAEVLERRTRQVLRSRVQRMRVIAPKSPHGLGSVLWHLLKEESMPSQCIWLKAVHFEHTGGSGGNHITWGQAWEKFLLRANEHRERIRRVVPGALIIAADAEIKTRIRDAAPDLWSIRSLVLDLHPSRPAERHQPSEIPGYSEMEWNENQALTAERSARLEFLSSEVARVARKIEAEDGHNPHGLVQLRLLLAEELLQQGRAREAAVVAQENVNLLRSRGEVGTLMAEALFSSSSAALAEGDVAVSREQLKEMIGIYREAVADHGRTPQTLRDLSIGLVRWGEVLKVPGELTAATEAHEEALTLRRELVEAYGETPQSLRDLSVSLGRMGDVRREATDLAAATEAYEEALALRRRLVEVYGETPQSLRDLSISLGRMGDVRREAGDLTAATEAHDEALALDRRLVEVYGENADSSVN